MALGDGVYREIDSRGFKPVARNAFEGTVEAVRRSFGRKGATAEEESAPPGGKAGADHAFRAVQLVEVALAEHVSAELVGEAVNASLAQVAEEVRALWTRTLEQILRDAERNAAQLSRYSTREWGCPTDIDRSFEILVSSSLMAVGATLALAAGWHTIWWALAHLFPGAMLAALLVGGAYAWLNKERARATLKESARSLIETIEHRVNADVQVYIRMDARKNARLTGENLRRVALNSNVGGKLSADQLTDLIRALESLLDDITRRCHTVETRQEAQLRRRLDRSIEQAQARLESSDLPGAAFLLGQAIELHLRLLGARLGQGSNAVARQGYMLENIDLLRTQGLITKSQADALHRLRQRRNWLFHDYDAVAETHGAKLSNWLGESIGELRQAGTVTAP